MYSNLEPRTHKRTHAGTVFIFKIRFNINTNKSTHTFIYMYIYIYTRCRYEIKATCACVRLSVHGLRSMSRCGPRSLVPMLFMLDLWHLWPACRCFSCHVGTCWNMLEYEATSHEALPEDDGALGESMEDTTGAAWCSS